MNTPIRMKNLKWIVFAILSILCLMGGGLVLLLEGSFIAQAESQAAFTVQTSEPTQAALTYEYNNALGGFVVSGIDTSDPDTIANKENLSIVIPAVYSDETHSEKNVVKIDYKAFSEGKHAGYNFTKLDISGATNLTTISDDAFYGCSGFIGELILPNSLEAIGSNAFSGCAGFTEELILPNSLEAIGSNAFSGCAGFTGELNIPNSVEKIWNNAFRDCQSFSGLTFSPNSALTYIGFQAFENCNQLKGALVIPNTVVTIGSSAFAYCKGLTSLTLPNNNGFTCIERNVFEYCTGLTGNLVLPEAVTKIEENAFKNCAGLTGELVLPPSLTKIGAGAFYGCAGFTGALRIPDSLTLIDGSAFQGCVGFTSLTFSQNSQLSTIGRETFYGCKGFIGELILPQSLTTLASNAFSNCTGFTQLTFSENIGLTDIGYGAFSDCTSFMGELKLPESVEIIGLGAFKNCAGFTGELNLPQSLEQINRSAFENCTGLSTLKFSQNNRLTTIQEKVFADCGFTGELVIPDSVTTIEKNAFINGKGLTSLKFSAGSSLTAIGSSAFYGCTGLTGELIMPQLLTTIGSSAFESCTNLTALIFEGNSQLTTIDKKAFYGCVGLAGELSIPKMVETIGESAFYGCAGLTGELIMPQSLTTIGSSAFASCTNLTALIFEENSQLTTINNNAFYGCTGFTGELTLPDSLTNIGWGAFANCNNFQTIYFPNNNAMIDTMVFYFSTCPIVIHDKAKYDAYIANGNHSRYLTYETTVTYDALDGKMDDSFAATQKKLYGFALSYQLDLDTKIWAANESYTLPTAVKGGYFMDGYTTSSTGEGEVVTAETIVTDAPTYYVNFIKVVLSSIRISSQPTKRTYTAFDTFDSTGMEVTANFNDGSRKIITDFVVVYRNGDSFRYRDSFVGISYTFEGVTKKTNVSRLTVNKKAVAKPTVTGSYVYNASEQSVVLNGFDENAMGIVSGGMATNAGKYNACVSLIDSNYQWEDKTTDNVVLEWDIAKADVATDSISFKDLTVKADGKAYKIEIAGKLPSGVSASYLGTGGYTMDGVSAAGIYEITATFLVDENYNIPQPMTATLTINLPEITGGIDSGDGAEIVIGKDDGMKPGTKVEINDKPVEDYNEKGIVIEEEDYTFKQVTEIVLERDGQAVQPNETITVKILIKEELREYNDLKVIVLSPNGIFEDANAVRKGNYMEFQTKFVSICAIVAPHRPTATDVPVLGAGAIAGIVILLLLLLLILLLLALFLLRKDKEQTFKEYYVELGGKCSSKVKGLFGKKSKIVKGEFIENGKSENNGIAPLTESDKRLKDDQGDGNDN